MPNRERIYRTEAVILRRSDFGEADRLLTVYTPYLGKVRLLAKGIRKPSSRKAGHLELFTRTQLLIARGRNLDIITQAESLEEFEGIRGDLARFTYACLAAELVDRFAQEEEDSADLYALMVQGLRWFATEEDLRLWMRYFELRLLSYSGYRPELFSCVGCQETIRPQVNFFSVEQGGLLCDRCGAQNAQAVAVSVNAQKVLRYLLTHDVAEIRDLHLQDATHAEVEALLQGYIEYTLERALKSVTFLRRLRRELRAAEGKA